MFIRDRQWLVSDVADSLGMVPRTLERLKRRFVEEGLEASLQRKERETLPRKIVFDGAFEARLLTVCLLYTSPSPRDS